MDKSNFELSPEQICLKFGIPIEQVKATYAAWANELKEAYELCLKKSERRFNGYTPTELRGLWIKYKNLAK